MNPTERRNISSIHSRRILTVDRKIQFTYEVTANEKVILANISDILGKEIFNYLKNQGYLKNKNRSDKVNKVVKSTKKILDKNQFSNLLEM